MKRMLVLPLLLIVLLFSVTGITMAEGKIAIVFATGGLGDKSFNDSAYEGMKMAEDKMGITFHHAEPTAIAEYETFLTQFANTRQYDLIISIGFDQADALNNVASRFPNQKFAIVDMVVDKPNVASYIFKEKERGFLLGVAAGLMTSNTNDQHINNEKVVGVIGGMKIPLIDANIAGFIAGAKYVDSDINVLHSYVGHWADPAKGKELTLSMIEQGADVIWGAAGRSGLGVIKAAEEQNVYAMGADSDQGYLAPDNILTNGMKFVNNTVFLAIQETINNEFKSGIHLLGVAENALGYTDSLLPTDVLLKLDEIKNELIKGEVEIPDTL